MICTSCLEIEVNHNSGFCKKCFEAMSEKQGEDIESIIYELNDTKCCKMEWTVAQLKTEIERQMNLLIKEPNVSGGYDFGTLEDEREYNRLWNLHYELAYFLKEY